MTVTLYNNCGASTRTGLSIDQVRYRLPRLGITPAPLLVRIPRPVVAP
jgi:hypothetical protein